MPDRLTIFAWLLAFANIAHQTTYSRWLSGEEPLGAALAVAAVALLLWPGSIALLLLLLALRLAFCVYYSPFLQNHILVEGFACAGILAGLIPALIRRRRLAGYSAAQREELFDTFSGIVRVLVLLLYAFTVFHKLNVDFFDLESGCGARFLVWARERYHFVPVSDWARIAATAFTLLVEGGIPLLLLFRRTRVAAIVVALGFHIALVLHPIDIYTFSSLMVALLFCWTPPGLPAALLGASRRFRRLAPRVSNRALAFASAFLTLALAAVLIAWKGGPLWQNLFSIGLALWCGFTLLTGGLYLGTIFAERPKEPSIGNLMRGIRPAQLAVALLFVINAANPYFGLKTHATLMMHSNLRTEGSGWNHLLLPEWLKVFGFQDDLIEVLESDLPTMRQMAEKRQALPFFEFRRTCREEASDFYVVYRRNGEVLRFEKRAGAGNDPVLAEKPHWLLERLLGFNPTDTAARQSCRAG